MNRLSKVGLAMGVAASLWGCRAEVARDLSGASAEEVMLALDEAGIAAEREASSGAADRYDVWVERDALVPAMALLRAESLPRGVAAGLDAPSDALLPSIVEEGMRRDAAVAEELRRSLEQLSGVHRARVHIARSTAPRLLDDPAPSARASVLVLQRGPAPDLDAVRSLVAGSVAGLTPEGINVVVEPAPPRPVRDASHVFVGPIAVSRSSAGLLRGALATALGLNLFLAGALVVQRRRLRT